MVNSDFMNIRNYYLNLIDEYYYRARVRETLCNQCGVMSGRNFTFMTGDILKTL